MISHFTNMFSHVKGWITCSPNDINKMLLSPSRTLARLIGGKKQGQGDLNRVCKRFQL